MRVLRFVTVATVVVALAAWSPGAVALKGKKRSGPVVVGTDDAGDWGSNAGLPVAPLGDVLGQDLVEASIGMIDAATIGFVIKVNSLPPAGGVPEFSRYNWDITVDEEPFQITGAFTDYLRGVCNPLHTGTCPPPKDPGMAPFFIRQGPCTVGADCFVRAVVNATFDPGAATITIPVPLEVLEAKPGSKIGPGATLFGGTIYAAPAVLVTQAALPNDTMVVGKTFVVPRGKKR